MDVIKNIIDFIIHIDHHLEQIIEHFGIWSYLLLFLIIFAETGLVVTPFLPGDSMLFAAGTFAAIGAFDVMALTAVLIAAAVLGDSANYFIGKFLGEKAYHHPKLIKKKYLDRTHEFYEKYGAKTIVIARFVPMVRTFAPFVAGIGNMSYKTFFAYNVAGGVLWVLICVLGGFFFGNIPIIRNNFSVAILVIVILSILPAVIEVWKHKKNKKKARNG